jgi:hypothetical protein
MSLEGQQSQNHQCIALQGWDDPQKIRLEETEESRTGGRAAEANNKQMPIGMCTGRHGLLTRFNEQRFGALPSGC